MFRIGAGVTRNQMQRHNGNVELVTAGIFQGQKLGRPVTDVKNLQAEIAADAMVLVHHRIADPQLREVLDDGFGVTGGYARAPTALGRPFAVELRFGNEGKRWIGQ